MNEFIQRIEKDVKQPKRDKYLETIENLYPGIWTDKDILEHIALLKGKEPEAKYTDFDEFLESQNVVYDDLTEGEGAGEVNWWNHYHSEFADQTKKKQITPTDLRIAKILKLRVEGLAITISPPEKHFSVDELLTKTSQLNKCKYLKSAKYYIEFHTDGSAYRPHIHMYAQLYNLNTLNINRTSSYIRKKFPKVSCSIERKLDITYGIQDYLSGNASTKKKQTNKEKDKKERKKLNIPDILIL